MADSLSRIKLQPHEIWMVKLADRIINLQPPPSHWKTAKRQRYAAEAQLIHEELKEASKYLSDRLCDQIQIYESYISQ